MLVFIFACLMGLVSLSPMSFSVVVVVVSLIIGFMSFIFYCVLIFPVVMVLLFSSGLMMIFCYCSILVRYEEVGGVLSVNYLFLFSILFMLSYFFLDSSFIFLVESFSFKMSSGYFINLLFFFLMSLIMVLLSCMSKMVYKPEKSMLESFLGYNFPLFFSLILFFF